MFNLYKLSTEEDYRILQYDDLLFVEYKCVPGPAEIDSLWSPQGHLVYVTSGKKTWITPEGEVPAVSGEAVFCKSGACLMRNYYETDFCALLFFFPLGLIKEVVLEFQLKLPSKSIIEANHENDHVLKINTDGSLRLFFESVATFFGNGSGTSEHLLKLKFKELILQVLTTTNNEGLKYYFLSTLESTRENMEVVMRKNLLFNLSIQDYAELCNRSVSSFKREFKNTFGVSPMHWIIDERLKYAKARLETSDEQINEIAFYSGFESVSHFIRCFKKQFGRPPNKYRTQYRTK